MTTTTTAQGGRDVAFHLVFNMNQQDFVPPGCRPTKGAKRAVRKLTDEITTLIKTKKQVDEALSVLKGLVASLRENDTERIKERKVSLLQ